jgi:trehalose 6-phosphate phosphatase
MDWQNDKTTPMLQTLISKPKLGIVTGMDGTIAPVADDAEGNPPSPRCRELLRDLSKVADVVAVLSARPVSQLHALIDLPDVMYLGNRGLELWVGGRVDYAPEMESYRPALESAMSTLYSLIDSSVQIEDAGSALLLYLDGVTDQAALEALRSEVSRVVEAKGLRLYEGQHLLEVRPPMVLDKGPAVERLVSSHDLEGVLYIGNDLSDVDAFEAVQTMRAQGTCYGAAVGVQGEWTSSEVSKADLLVQGITGVEALLAWLLSARQGWLAEQPDAE